MVKYTEETSINSKIRGYYLFLCLVGFFIILGQSTYGSINIPISINNQHSSYDDSVNPCNMAQSGAPHPDDCLTCHDVRGGYGPGLLVAPNSTELCGMCHSEEYNSYRGTTHDLVGVFCTDCHGYDLRSDGSPFLNHSFASRGGIACGQSDFCHADMFGHTQLEIIGDTYPTLVEEILFQIDRLQGLLDEYTANPEANTTIAESIQTTIDDSQDIAQTYDRSYAYHNWKEVNTEMVNTYNNLVYARALLAAADYDLPSVNQTVSTTLLFTVSAIVGLLVSLVVGGVIGKYRFR